MSKIEWTEETWNPIVGCSKVSPGCQNCYAIREAHRMAGNPNPKISSIYQGLTTDGPNVNWTREVRFVAGRLNQPLSWKRPRMIFVNSMSDLFHEDLSFAAIEMIFETMMKAKQHTFQVLTKRPQRMYDFWQWCVNNHLRLADRWPLPNVWLGTSVENQEYADERIPWLVSTPAAVHFLSCEPLLGPIDLELSGKNYGRDDLREMIDWVIVGGESGSKARPMHPNWTRSIRAQCEDAGVPFFFKQWGAWLPMQPTNMLYAYLHADTGKRHWHSQLGSWWQPFDGFLAKKIGKKKAGRLLDGKEHNAFPEVQHAP